MQIVVLRDLCIWSNRHNVMYSVICFFYIGSVFNQAVVEIGHQTPIHINQSSTPANTLHWINGCLILAKRRRRWANVEPTMVQCIVFTRNGTQGHKSVFPTNARCWTYGGLMLSSVVDDGPKVIQHCENMCHTRDRKYSFRAVTHKHEIKCNASALGHFLCTYRHNWARRTSWGWWDKWDKLPARHRIQNSSPGGLWPSTLPLGHGGKPRVDGEETFFVSFKPPRPGSEPRFLAWNAAVLTTTLPPPPPANTIH